MVINAEGFTLWKRHFKLVEGIATAWSGGVLVTLGTYLFCNLPKIDAWLTRDRASMLPCSRRTA